MKGSRLVATIAAGALCLSLALSAFGQKAGAGRIVGHIDGIAVDAVAGPPTKSNYPSSCTNGVQPRVHRSSDKRAVCRVYSRTLLEAHS